jgi:hypothetical protein
LTQYKARSVNCFLSKFGLCATIVNLTSTNNATETTEKSVQPSPISAAQPTSIFTLQPSASGTVQLNNVPTNSLGTAIPATDIVWEMIGQVNKDRRLTDLRHITGEEKNCIDDKCY